MCFYERDVSIMQKRWILGILALFMMVLFVSGCGQNKIVGTWIGPNSHETGSAALITIEQKDNNTFSVKLSHLHGTGNGDEAKVIEDKPKELIGKANDKDGTVLQVQSNGVGNNNISYNKDKDVISTMLGTQMISEFTRIKGESDMDKAKEKTLDAYKNSASEKAYQDFMRITNGN